MKVITDHPLKDTHPVAVEIDGVKDYTDWWSHVEKALQNNFEPENYIFSPISARVYFKKKQDAVMWRMLGEKDSGLC